MKPLDPRLLRHARRARAAIAVLAVGGLASAALVIAQAWLLADMIAEVFVDKATLAACTPPLAALAGVTVGRAAVAWAAQAAGYRASAEAKTELRTALLARVLALGPGWRRGPEDPGDGGRRDGAALTQLATTGLDGLDGYFTRYLPALIGAVAIPLAALIAITVADPVSGILVACTLPLVPLLGALIGRVTGRQAAQGRPVFAALAHHFHDVLSGLPTLRVLGRTQAQREQIEREAHSYRRVAGAALRLSSLSTLAVDLSATLSVALVATELGLRLAYGHLNLRTGLLVLICAAEAYLPLRALGGQFCAAADGLAAAGQVVAILETETETEIEIPRPVSFTIEPGRLTVLIGPSGCGKSALLSCLLGFAKPTSGSVRSQALILNGPVVPVPAQDCAPPGRDEFGWLPQDPTLFTGTVAENIRLGWPAAPDEAVAAAARAAALDDVLLTRVLGDRDTGLSASQRRRVALARALLPGRPVLLLDEPTAGLDAGREAIVIETLRRYAAAGHAVLAVSDRPAVIAAADSLVDLSQAHPRLITARSVLLPPPSRDAASSPDPAATSSPNPAPTSSPNPAAASPAGTSTGVGA